MPKGDMQDQDKLGVESTALITSLGKLLVSRRTEDDKDAKDLDLKDFGVPFVS